MYRSRLSVFISIFLLILVFIVLHYTKVLGSTEYILRRFFSPISQKIFSVGSYLKEKKEFFNHDVLSENEVLKEKLLECQKDTALVKMLRDENSELRDQLSFFQSKDFVHVGAEVIGRNIQPLGSTLVINRGKRDGIAQGNAVIISNGILIGKVIQAEEESSLVRLLNDNQSKVAATILNREKSIGIVEGGYGISVRMNFIPQQEDIHVGDLVITSGLETGMPRGLLIGNIAAIEKEAYEPFQKTVLNPSASLSSLTFVSVILRK